MLKSTSRYLQDMGLKIPSVLLDRARAEANIRRMADRAAAAGARFRPHFKTHQSGVVGQWFRDAGIERIAVSSLAMAEQFAALGWRDIMVAILHNPRETGRAAALATRLSADDGRLHLVLDDPTVAADLSAAVQAPLQIWLKIDTGYGRTGLIWDDAAKIKAVCAACTDRARPRGLLTHAGVSYAARGADAVENVYHTALKRLRQARAATDRPDLELSFGDTPCCSLVPDLSACDEIRPGNFVFYDLMQLQIGSCSERQMAAAVVCPVIGVYPQRHRIVLHGGAVHLSKESLSREDGLTVYGCLGTIENGRLGQVLTQAPLISLSQEHGIVALPPIAIDAPDKVFADGLAPGDLVLVWPVHSCLSCDQLREQMAAPAIL